MDRFLCLCPISRQTLQLLGTCCLLLASKIRQCHALTVDLLCAYTDHSVTPDQIRVSIRNIFVIFHFKRAYVLTAHKAA